MKIHRAENGNVLIELESQREITAVWAVCSHVGGGMQTPHAIFSNKDSCAPGLTQLLVPFITMPDSAKDRYGVKNDNPPPITQDTLAAHCGAVLTGGLNFSETSDV